VKGGYGMAMKILFCLLLFFFLSAPSAMTVGISAGTAQSEEKKPAPKPDTSERDKTAIPPVRITFSRKEE